MPQLSARDRLHAALERIDDPKGEGARACLTVYRAQAMAAADAADTRARDGISLGALDGKIVSIKDLFDVAGEVTRAGSKVLADEGKPAERDAPVVQRLRAAGAVIVAKTNMSEFAFTGIGANPHFGTPGNPADRARAPGGSSSGAGVAVADGMCEIGIGTDTGGSVRIPAALCGVVGFKPSRQRVPTTGVFPLSYSLDSVGPLARSVAECAKADAVMAGEAAWPLEPAPLSGLRIGVAQGLPLENLDDTVGKRFPEALDLLEKAGARMSNEKLPPIDDMMRVLSRTSLLVAEVYSVHRDRLARRGDDIDQIVRGRMEKGRDISSADYIDVVRARTIWSPRRGRRAQGLHGAQCHAVAQHDHRQFPRRLRHLATFAAPRRPADGPDAGRAQRPRSQPAAHCRRGRAPVGRLRRFFRPVKAPSNPAGSAHKGHNPGLGGH
jgi:aspartyl-tRNA(Asn)/glutamyl-tRNA(Gln) amidotransferase subunit A